jgi:hypothetical protein
VRKATHTHRPREDGLPHPADTSRSNLAAALGLLSRHSKPLTQGRGRGERTLRLSTSSDTPRAYSAKMPSRSSTRSPMPGMTTLMLAVHSRMDACAVRSQDLSRGGEALLDGSQPAPCAMVQPLRSSLRSTQQHWRMQCSVVCSWHPRGERGTPVGWAGAGAAGAHGGEAALV